MALFDPTVLLCCQFPEHLGSFVGGSTSGNVKLLLPPRQSRGVSRGMLALVPLGLLFMLNIAGPATAADQAVLQRERPPQTARPAAQQQANWSGTQVGGFGGESSVSNGFAEPGANLFFACIPRGGTCFSPLTSVPDTETPFGFDKDKLSFTFGGFVGYRWQFASIVTGVEGDFAFKRATTSSTLATAADASYPVPFAFQLAHRTETFFGESKQTWDASIRARLGVLVSPNILLYGTGGVAFGEVSGAFSYAAVFRRGIRTPFSG